MARLLTVLFAHWSVLLAALLWTAPLGYGVYLFSQEVHMREELALRSSSTGEPPKAIQAQVEFNPDAIATVMGLAAQTAVERSAEPLTLRGSFVSSTGLSRALLAGADGERLYQVGDSLPGGSVLRRIEMSRVVLWRKGREELLILQPGTESPVLRPNPTVPRPAPALLHLRPSTHLSQGH